MQLSLKDVHIAFGSHDVVKNFNLELAKGEIGCLLGPSGCGKTTLQRAIAGFQPISAGTIELADKTVSTSSLSVQPERRKIGMVFQDFALFPHLNVEKNVGFGIKNQSKAKISQRVDDLLRLVGLLEHKHKYPHELSGGQQQRIALIRAIAAKPEIILLDEPFSSLDSSLREFIAKEVRKLLKKNNITAILVTHDQHEAFAFADKVGVMKNGQLQQWDTPYNLYHKPVCKDVANFIGDGAFITGVINEQGGLSTPLGIIDTKESLSIGTKVDVLVRPDDIVFDEHSEISFEISDKLFRGAEYLYQLRLSGEQYILCVTPSHINLSVGEFLPVSTDLKHLIFFSS